MSMTMNVYTSVEDGLRKQAVSKLHAALQGVGITADVGADVPQPDSFETSQAQV